MSVLLIPVAPLSRTKSRLRDCFSKEQLKELTKAMFKDLANTASKIDEFNHKIVYCNSPEILDLAKDYDLIGIKEEQTNPRKSFDHVIDDLNTIAVKNYKAQSTVFTFLDTILISENNLSEINNLMKNNQLVICPAIHSAGISVLGRNPPNILPTYFSEPTVPSLIATVKSAKKNKIKFAIYDSFRAGFDIDLKQDLVMAYDYLKMFNLTDTETFKFLKRNLRLSLLKKNASDNRIFEIKTIE